MKGFQDITIVELPFGCLKNAFESLRKTGALGVEGVALFVGKKEGTVFKILKTIIPEHSSYAVEEGLFYAIGSDELYRLNRFLYEEGLRLFAQIHSHPHEAYHSTADDTNAVITTVGGLSIVVRNFAFGPVSLEECAIFRLNINNEWIQLSNNEIDQLIRVS